MKRLRSSGIVSAIDPSGSVNVLSQITDLLFGIQSDIAQIVTEYNSELYSTIGSLSRGEFDTRWNLLDNTINPKLNNLDGANLFVDTDSSSASNEGRFFNSRPGKNRPKTIKESFLDLSTDISSMLDKIRGEINSIDSDEKKIATYNTSVGIGNLVDKDVRSVILDGTTVVASSAGSNTISITVPGGYITDEDALHSNIAGEIESLSSKGTPVSGDVFLIEDSADSDSKKRITFGSITHGNQGGGTLHSAATISVAGFMSAADKTKLDGIEAAATDNATWISFSDTQGSIPSTEFVQANSGGTALEFYDLFASANTWSNTQTFGSGVTMSGGDIIPSSDSTRNIGTAAYRFATMRAAQGVFVDGDKTPIIWPIGDIGILAGKSDGTGSDVTMQMGGPSTNYPPLAIIGNVTGRSGCYSRIRNEGGGSTIIGSSVAFTNGGNTAYIDCAPTSYGSLTGGYSYTTAGFPTNVAGILNESSGSLMWGYSHPTLSNPSVIKATSSAKGSLTVGYVTGNREAEITNSGHGSLTGGLVDNEGPTGYIRGKANGSITWGSCVQPVNSWRLKLSTSSLNPGGVFSGGYLRGVNGGATAYAGPGSIVRGYMHGGTISADLGSLSIGSATELLGVGASSISSTTGGISVGMGEAGNIYGSTGSFCFGRVKEGTIESVSGTVNGGGLACGYVESDPSNYIRVNQDAGIAMGYVTGSSGSIYSNGIAATAIGSVDGGSLSSSGTGSFALGDASISSITASGNGNLAIGEAPGAITASGAQNCFQFSPGVNAQANSFQVGSAGLRLMGAGTAGTPQNGDLWLAGGYLYVRSNGVNCKCVNAIM